MDARSRTVVVEIASAVHSTLQSVVLPREEIIAVTRFGGVSFTLYEGLHIVNEGGKAGRSLDEV